MASLWAHVVGCADHSHSKLLLSGATEDLRNAKVTYFYGVVACEEQILSLDVPVDDFLGVEVCEAKSRLEEPVVDVRFGDLLLVLRAALDLERQVTDYTVDVKVKSVEVAYLRSTP